MKDKAFTHTLSKEIISRAQAMSPTDRLRWLAAAKEFVYKNVPSEKIETWKKLAR